MPYLEEMDTVSLVTYLNQQDTRPQAAVRTALLDLAGAVDAILHRVEQGGRVRVIGAGTSGRLAQLDASELPPTFGIAEDLWSAIMAGGRDAFWQAVEGAEDDREAGHAAVERQDLGESDVVIGVAASGRTPFVWGALEAAAARGCLRVGVVCVPDTPWLPLLDIAITLPVGEESLQGSTRMLAGTAQKMALNILSTGVMVKRGHVVKNLMIDMRPSNQKLRQRAQFIVASILGCSDTESKQLLEDHHYEIRRALVSWLTEKSGDALNQAVVEESIPALLTAKGLNGIDVPVKHQKGHQQSQQKNRNEP